METPSFETFCSDPQLLDEPISKPWAVFYAAMDGLPLDAEGVKVFRACTGRDRYEPRTYTEGTGICGRRSEKTSTALKYLLWKLMFAGWEKQLRSSWFAKLARHTRVLRIPLIAQDQRISRDNQRTLESLVLNSPILSKEVAEVFTHEMIFRNGLSTICVPASKASVRGMTCPACLLDELAWVSIDGADDKELIRQVKPSMIQFGQSRRLIKLSTPWQRGGVLYDEFSHRDERPSTLVWQASTATMTPRIDPAELEKEKAADPSYFSREYDAQFTDDLELFIPSQDSAAAIANWKELPPGEGVPYIAALDASGLSGGDRFTFGIAHGGQSGAWVDLLRGWRRATVPQVCDEIASLCRAYTIESIIADQYSFVFLQELLRERGLALEQLAFTARSKPEIFFCLKNFLAQGRMVLPDHPEMLRELRALESVRTSGGNYRIGAPRSSGQHDDYATTLALLAHRLAAPEITEPIFEVIDLRDSFRGIDSREARCDWKKIF